MTTRPEYLVDDTCLASGSVPSLTLPRRVFLSKRIVYSHRVTDVPTKRIKGFLSVYPLVLLGALSFYHFPDVSASDSSFMVTGN